MFVGSGPGFARPAAPVAATGPSAVSYLGRRRNTELVNEVVIPRAADGRRSSVALGRAVVADALRVVDPAAAAAAEAESDWRRGYPRHFRALIEAGLRSDEAGYEIAAA